MNTDKLISVIREAGFEPRELPTVAELVFACPLCDDEKSRLYISAERGAWICHHCGARGHLRGFLVEVCGLSFQEAYIAARSIAGDQRKSTLPTIGRRRREQTETTVHLPPVLKDSALTTEYLRQRGIQPRWAGEIGIGVCTMGYYAGRIVVPVYTEGQLRTFVARSYLPHWQRDKHRPKVLTPPMSQAANALFGYDIVSASYDTVRLVEGVFDAMRMWNLGYYSTLATLGAHVTPEQRRLLKRKGYTTVVLVRDGDNAGREAALKEARELHAAGFKHVMIADLPDGVDPGNATNEQMSIALNTAREISSDYGSTHIGGR